MELSDIKTIEDFRKSCKEHMISGCSHCPADSFCNNRIGNAWAYETFSKIIKHNRKRKLEKLLS